MLESLWDMSKSEKNWKKKVLCTLKFYKYLIFSFVRSSYPVFFTRNLLIQNQYPTHTCPVPAWPIISLQRHKN